MTRSGLIISGHILGEGRASHPYDLGSILESNNNNIYWLALAAAVLQDAGTAVGPEVKWERGLSFDLAVKPFLLYFTSIVDRIINLDVQVLYFLY